MSRRLAFENLSRDVCLSNGLILTQIRTRACNGMLQPLCHQPIPSYFRCDEGELWSSPAGQKPQVTRSVSHLECALTGKHRVLPAFGRSCPSTSPLESSLTKKARITPLECALAKKGGALPDVIHGASQPDATAMAPTVFWIYRNLVGGWDPRPTPGPPHTMAGKFTRDTTVRSSVIRTPFRAPDIVA
jgi:hypothetical protein